ncbi:MAG: carboxypeptidase-like regulatory domain-containing protein, partial [Crocinitomicaceae bacterium]
MNQIKGILLIVSCFLILVGNAQQTKIVGKVTDAQTGEELPFVKVRFYLSKMGTSTDTAGNYVLETYYATDSLQFSFIGYQTTTVAVKLDQTQEINVQLRPEVFEMEEVFVRPPDELMSTILHKKVIANKRINNKEKLDSYDYEVYNKLQLDLNNIGDKFTERGLVQRLDVVMNYLDSTDDGTTYLPVLLSESISDFYFRNNPKKKKEVIKASKISGIENIQINQLLGDMYLDMNIYDNYINLFQRAFISPVSNAARSFYKFTLSDSAFIDNYWCYRLDFQP